MSITRDDVAHVAELARLAMTDEELDEMHGHFGAILEHFARLAAVDTEGVEPTFHPLVRRNVTRPDQIRPPMDRSKLLANAPSADDECFLAPQIMEDE
ncbi:MAG: Asp-tRNA(Asn)/Glu-tRNA(Gln) amidotransferase subunit GatC [Armatimonadia bacterium]|nr:Asp-tRNA(Asn)/Glu-tRNA(Gln) amidotransferase subunit GatC [Armatimonadia bacterium]